MFVLEMAFRKTAGTGGGGVAVEYLSSEQEYPPEEHLPGVLRL